MNLINTYFTHYFLTPKKTQKQNDIICFSLFMANSVFAYLVSDILVLRTSVAILVNIYVCVYWYKDTLVRKLLAVIAIVFAGLPGETLMAICTNIILGVEMNAVMPPLFVITMYVIDDFIMFFVMFCILKGSKNLKILNHSSDKVLFWIPFLFFLQTLIFIILDFVLAGFVKNLYIPLIIIAILCMLFDALFLFFVPYTYEYNKRKVYQRKLQNVYDEQLNSYLKLRDTEEKTRYLRHELMNQWETIYSMKLKDE